MENARLKINALKAIIFHPGAISVQRVTGNIDDLKFHGAIWICLSEEH